MPHDHCPTPRPPRAVIYTRDDHGLAPVLSAQSLRCARHATDRGYTIAGYAHDTADTATGYRDACRMVVAGRADLIVVAPGVTLPAVCPIEVAGGSDGGPRRPRLLH